MIDLSIHDELESYRDKFSEYVTLGDAKGLASLYTENACLMANKSPIYEGQLQIVEFYKRSLKDGFNDIKLTANEIIDMGDYVAERGDAKIIWTSKGENIKMIDKYVLLWKKTPESYKIHWDIFNSNNP
jgi:ketosteroid isomerase-like protein